MNRASILFRCRLASCRALSRGYCTAPLLSRIGRFGVPPGSSLANNQISHLLTIRQCPIWTHERRKHTMEFGADCVAEGDCAPPPPGILDPAPEDGVQTFNPPEVENVRPAYVYASLGKPTLCIHESLEQPDVLEVQTPPWETLIYPKTSRIVEQP
jgi:hypothetical protein